VQASVTTLAAAPVTTQPPSTTTPREAGQDASLIQAAISHGLQEIGLDGDIVIDPPDFYLSDVHATDPGTPPDWAIVLVYKRSGSDDAVVVVRKEAGCWALVSHPNEYPSEAEMADAPMALKLALGREYLPSGD
jgi:hypothetical protein